MLQIRNCTLIHKKDLRVILQEFQLTLNDGDKAVLIGEEGNGKSTLMKWLFDPELVEGYVEAKGERILNHQKLGYLPQEMSMAEKQKTIYAYFTESSCFYDQSPKELAGMAKRFMVSEDFFYGEQTMGSLSGGERIKAQLMRLLMERPDVLLLDEPSNDVDIDALELLERIIKEWKQIVLFISHDETLIENTANMVIHLEQIMRKTKSRYTVAKMPYQQYVTERLHAFERQEQQAITERKDKQVREEKYRRLLQKVEHAQGAVSRQAPSVAKNLKDKMHTVKAMGKRFEKMNENMTEMPQQEEAIFFKLGEGQEKMPAGKIVLEYDLSELRTPDGERVLARDIHLLMRGQTKVCLVGKNGCGKTTLLKKIKDSLKERTDISVEYMPQNYEELLDLEKTPVDFLDLSGDKEERTRIRTYLGALKYTADEMDHPMQELSGGQKAKVLLLKMSLSKANVLILDEPTRNFSPLSGPVIRRLLSEFPGAILCISHDRKMIREVCDTVLRLTESGLEQA